MTGISRLFEKRGFYLRVGNVPLKPYQILKNLEYFKNKFRLKAKVYKFIEFLLKCSVLVAVICAE